MAFTRGWQKCTPRREDKGGSGKKLFAVAVPTAGLSVPSFGPMLSAVSQYRKETHKAAKASSKDTGKAGRAVVNFFF